MRKEERRGGRRQDTTHDKLTRSISGTGTEPGRQKGLAFCGAWLERPPGALALAFERGGWGLLESRRCGEKPWGSQESQSTPGHPGERV